jgi:hypothetical protein
MIRRILTLALSAAIVLMAIPVPTLAQTTRGWIGGETAPNVTVRLRDLGMANLVKSTTSNGSGAFNFADLNAGTFAVEVLDPHGNVKATSGMINLRAGHMTVSNIGLLPTLADGAGNGGGAFLAPAGLLGMGPAMAGLVVAAVATAGIVGGLAAAGVIGSSPAASPSR